MSASENNPAPEPYLDFPNHTHILDTDFQSYRSRNKMSVATLSSKRRFNEKLKKMLRKSNQENLKSSLNPITTATVNISADNYISSFLNTQPSDKPAPSIQFTSFNLHEMIKYDITSRLTGDLGFLVYTKGGFGVTTFTPRITYNLWNGYKVQLSSQLGDRATATLGILKTYHKSDLECQVSSDAKRVSGMVSLSQKFSDQTKGSITYTHDVLDAASFSLKHILTPSSHIKHEFKRNSYQTTLQLLYKHFLTKKIALIGGGAIILSTPGTVTTFATNLKLALAYKFSDHTKLSYSVEHEEGTLKFVSSIKRGGLNISIPIALSHNGDFRIATLALATLGIASYVTRRIYNYVFSDEHPDAVQEKHTKIIEEIRAHRAEAMDYSNMIRDKVLIDKRTEFDKRGLVITEAYYGRKDRIEKILAGAELRFDEYTEVIDVSLVLQFLVHDSKLTLTSASKSHIAGIYNPCIKSSTSPVLFIKYSHGGLTHSLFIQDEEDLYIP